MPETLIVVLLAFGIFALIVRRIIKAKKYREQIQSVTSMDRGTWSERDLIPQLLNKCGIDQRAIYHDLYIRKSDGTYTQIDLAVPTPQGIIAFEVKDYSGWIFGNENSKYWMQVLAYGKEKHQFYNPIWQNHSHITALRKLLPNNPDVPIFNIVVFYGNCEFKDLDYDTTGRVRVIYGGSQVKRLINHIKTLEPGNYGNKREVANVLAEGVKNGRDPEIRQAQQKLAARAKANGRETHTYSSGGWWFGIPLNEP
ncbi:MAG: NERD domain-containing protein [Bacteroidales bacterium]|nr:NERD domain-containing protein [Bacteroidales bacterium]